MIGDYLDALRGRLPADAVAELADGLLETYEHHRVRGLDPDAAAWAAVADFGAPDTVIRAFVQVAPGRRTARTLLATGPIGAACWAAALLTARAWTWPVPAPAAGAFAVVLVTVAAVLAAACRLPYRHSRRAALAGGVGLLTLDAAAVTGLLMLAPALTTLLQCAALASGLRTILTVGLLRRLIVTS